MKPLILKRPRVERDLNAHFDFIAQDKLEPAERFLRVAKILIRPFMRIPQDATIADEKLTRYLLMRRPWDDKSGFLAQAGFTLYNWAILRQAIRSLADVVEATEGGENEYGAFYQVRGPLVGPTGALDVKLIWMRRAIDERFYFVTLVPAKE